MEAKPGHISSWFMNGDLVAEGQDKNSLTYTFHEPGEYVLNYIESMKENGEITSATCSTAHTRVVPVPGNPTVVTINTETEFAPPPGYQKHAWRFDGKELSTEPTLKVTFKDSAPHTIECMASSPINGPAEGFLRIRYNTMVNPK
jgi:hypothetical protein